MSQGRLLVIAGAVNALLSVALGAFGAHGLKGQLAADGLAVYQTAVQYHMFHALGLLCVGVLAGQIIQHRLLYIGGWLLLVGIILFSGSLYALSLSGFRALGIITPFGGLAFLSGWLLIAVAVVKSESSTV